MTPHQTWLSIAQFALDSQNGVTAVELYFANHQWVCEFKLSDGVVAGKSVCSMQEAAELCYYHWWHAHRVVNFARLAEDIARYISSGKREAAEVAR